MKRSFAAKTISLVLILMLAVSLAACGGGSKYAGTYKLESIETAGISMNVDEFLAQMAPGEDVDFSITLTIKDGGTCKLDANAMGESQSSEGTWKENGSDTLDLTIEGDTQQATYKDGKISMDFEGVKIVLAK